MPYKLEKVPSGWFVAKSTKAHKFSKPKERFSKKPFETKKAATQQLKALYASESREMIH
jgi:hypothetical protein